MNSTLGHRNRIASNRAGNIFALAAALVGLTVGSAHAAKATKVFHQPFSGNTEVPAMISHDGDLYIAAGGLKTLKVFRLNDPTTMSWTDVTPKIKVGTNSIETALESFGGQLFLGTPAGEVFRLDAKGSSATKVAQFKSLSHLAVFGGKLYALAADGLCRTSNGTQWENLGDVVKTAPGVFADGGRLESHGGQMYMGFGFQRFPSGQTSTGGKYLEHGIQIWQTSDGKSWKLLKKVSADHTKPLLEDAPQHIHAMKSYGKYLHIGEFEGSGGAVFRTTGSAGSWEVCQVAPYGAIEVLEAHGGRLFAGRFVTKSSLAGEPMLYQSVDGKQWLVTPGAPAGDKQAAGIMSIASHNGKLYFGTRDKGNGGEVFELAIPPAYVQLAKKPDDSLLGMQPSMVDPSKLGPIPEPDDGTTDEIPQKTNDTGKKPDDSIAPVAVGDLAGTKNRLLRIEVVAQETPGRSTPVESADFTVDGLSEGFHANITKEPGRPGWFTTRLPAGTYRVFAERPGFPPASESVEIAGRDASCRLVFRRHREGDAPSDDPHRSDPDNLVGLRVKVVNAHGQALPDAVVRLNLGSGMARGQEPKRVGGNGIVDFRVPRNDWQYWVSAFMHESVGEAEVPARWWQARRDEADVVVRIPLGEGRPEEPRPEEPRPEEPRPEDLVDLRVNVVDANGRSLRDAVVRLNLGSGMARGQEPQRAGGDGIAKFRVPRNDLQYWVSAFVRESRGEAEVPVRWWQARRGEADVVVRISTDGGGLPGGPKPPPDGPKPPPKNEEPRPMHWVDVRVEEAGSPRGVPSAQVTVMHGNGPFRQARPQPTDRRGQVRFHLPHGSYWLRASARGYKEGRGPLAVPKRSPEDGLVRLSRVGGSEAPGPPPPPPPPQKAQLTVQVVDGDGRPMGGANVRVNGPQTGGGLTVGGGNWHANLNAGTYSITVSKQHYHQQKRDGVVLGPGQHAHQRFTLTGGIR